MAYVHQQLNRLESEIRLLKLLPRYHSANKNFNDDLYCEIFTVRLSDGPIYKALSYTWGDLSEGVRKIFLNGLTFQIRQNLWQALRQLRQDNTDLVIWIDAICINQAEIGERNHQVSYMGQIYRKATEVLVWLGAATNDSDLAFGLVQEVDDHQDDEKWVAARFQNSQIEHEVDGLIKVLSRPWFDRIWIVQEAALGSIVTLICGTSRLDAGALDRFQRLMYVLKMPNGNFFTNILSSSLDARTTLVWRGLRPIWTTRSALEAGTLRLSEAMQYNASKLSTEPRDMVYGLIGLAPEGQAQSFTVDYTCGVAEVYARFVKHDIEDSGTLEFFTNVLWGVPCDFNKPSWVPDYSRNRRGHVRLRNIRESHFYYSACGSGSAARFNFSPDLISLTVSGRVLCSVCATGGPTQMKDLVDFDKAMQIFPKWAKLIASLDTDGLGATARDISFGRCLLANRFQSAEIEDLRVPAEDFLRLMLGEWVSWAVEVCGYTILLGHPLLLQWLNYRLEQSTSVIHEFTRILRLWIRDSCRYIWDRMLVLSESDKGLIGLGPDTALVGDLICIFDGCSLPMVVRPFNSHFYVIGEAYVDKCMYGESEQDANDDTLWRDAMRDFELH